MILVWADGERESFESFEEMMYAIPRQYDENERQVAKLIIPTGTYSYGALIEK